MKAIFEKVDLEEGQSLIIRALNLPEFDAPWHFHPEMELTYIIKSRGTRFVGNSIEEFVENDLVLLGSNLPHIWQNPSNQSGRSEAIVVHFSEGMLNNSLLSSPEFATIRQLIEKASYGVAFPLELSKRVGQKLAHMVNAGPFSKVLGLMETLQLLATSNEARTLASVGYAHHTTAKDAEKMTIVFEYVRQHFSEVIRLDPVANLLHQTPQAFCRYFKKRAKKTFIEFVNEFRIGHASRLLIDTELSITEVCLQSGYSTIPHFNKQFKRITGLSPSGFRKNHVG
ncbi:MAG: AraC family transcriptional regulator [Imperialibacter sp.]|uniref:AraC family transcriptional regulator n=1 Tax=Imperialibacter sp. TaxID=2038411 RepID=UPI0032EE6A89